MVVLIKVDWSETGFVSKNFSNPDKIIEKIYVNRDKLDSLNVKTRPNYPRLRSRPKLIYNQTQSSAHQCVLRPKLQGLDGSSSALPSWRWSGDCLIRGSFGLKSLIISGFERTWVWSKATSSAIWSDHNFFDRTWVWSEMFSNAIGSDQGHFRAPYFLIFFLFFLLRDVGSAKRQQ